MVREGTAPDVVAGGVTTWFTGMYSPESNPRGHVTGVQMPDGTATHSFTLIRR